MTRGKRLIYLGITIIIYGMIGLFKTDLMFSEFAGALCIGWAARELACADGMPVWQDWTTDASDIQLLVTAGCMLLA